MLILLSLRKVARAAAAAYQGAVEDLSPHAPGAGKNLPGMPALAIPQVLEPALQAAVFPDQALPCLSDLVNQRVPCFRCVLTHDSSSTHGLLAPHFRVAFRR